MASVYSNFPAVRDAIRGIGSAWDFRGPGRFGTLGEDVKSLVTQAVVDRTVLQQKDPYGNPLAPLAPATIARKERHGYPLIISVQEGEMMSPAEVRGVGDTERRSVSLIYGTNDETKLKAEWFQEGISSHNQPPRPFYDLDDETEAQIDALLEEVLERRIAELGGR